MELIHDVIRVWFYGMSAFTMMFYKIIYNVIGGANILAQGTTPPSSCEWAYRLFCVL